MGPVEARVAVPETPIWEEVPMFSRERAEEEWMVRLERGIVSPIAPLKVMVPAPAVRSRPPGPSTVLLKRMLPLPGPVLRVAMLDRVTGEEKEMLALEVVREPLRRVG